MFPAGEQVAAFWLFAWIVALLVGCMVSLAIPREEEPPALFNAIKIVCAVFCVGSILLYLWPVAAMFGLIAFGIFLTRRLGQHLKTKERPQ